MISVVIPTYNRIYTLEKVLPSYYEQENVSQVVIVDDCSTEDLAPLAQNFTETYPAITTTLVRHPRRRGAPVARNTGVTHSTKDYILFGEDDVYMEAGYSTCLLNKLQQNHSLGLISGKRVTMLPGESLAEARERYGNGLFSIQPYMKYSFLVNEDAAFEGDITVPLTQPIILTYKTLLQQHPFDEFFANGNGFREDSTFQAKVFTNNYTITITNDTRCYHMNRTDASRGGQRTSLLTYYLWSVYYNHHFLKRYYKGYKQKLGLKFPRWIAEITFASIHFWNSILKAFCPQPLKKIGKRIKKHIFRP